MFGRGQVSFECLGHLWFGVFGCWDLLVFFLGWLLLGGVNDFETGRLLATLRFLTFCEISRRRIVVQISHYVDIVWILLLLAHHALIWRFAIHVERRDLQVARALVKHVTLVGRLSVVRID